LFVEHVVCFFPPKPYRIPLLSKGDLKERKRNREREREKERERERKKERERE
jgi:hypothetical protein